MIQPKFNIIHALLPKTRLLVFAVLVVMVIASFVIPEFIAARWVLAIFPVSAIMFLLISKVSSKIRFLKNAHRIEATIQFTKSLGENRVLFSLRSEENNCSDSYILLLTQKQKDKLVIQDNRLFINVNPAYPGKVYPADIAVETPAKEKGSLGRWISNNEGLSIFLGIMLIVVVPIIIVVILLPPAFKTLRYIHAGNDYVWELYSYQNADFKSDKYIIKVCDISSGEPKTIKSITKKHDDIPYKLALIEGVNKVWVVGINDGGGVSFADCYDAQSYAYVGDISNMLRTFLKSGANSFSIIDKIKIVNEYPGTNIPIEKIRNQIIQITTVKGDIIYFDVKSEYFYKDYQWNDLLVDNGIARKKLPYHGDSYHYLQTNTKFPEISCLVKFRAISNDWYNDNTFPYDNPYGYWRDTTFPEFSFRNARIVYYDTAMIAVMHDTDTTNTANYQISFYTHDGKEKGTFALPIQTEIYKTNASTIETPAVKRMGNTFYFKSDYLGVFKIDLNTSKLQITEKPVRTNRFFVLLASALYYFYNSSIPIDCSPIQKPIFSNILLNAEIQYQTEEYAVVYYEDEPEHDDERYILPANKYLVCIRKDGKVLWEIDKK